MQNKVLFSQDETLQDLKKIKKNDNCKICKGDPFIRLLCILRLLNISTSASFFIRSFLHTQSRDRKTLSGDIVQRATTC